jgi:hypothetical protein
VTTDCTIAEVTKNDARAADFRGVAADAVSDDMGAAATT